MLHLVGWFIWMCEDARTYKTNFKNISFTPVQTVASCLYISYSYAPAHLYVIHCAVSVQHDIFCVLCDGILLFSTSWSLTPMLVACMVAAQYAGDTCANCFHMNDSKDKASLQARYTQTILEAVIRLIIDRCNKFTASLQSVQTLRTHHF